MTQLMASIAGLLIAFLFMVVILFLVGYKKKNSHHEPLQKSSGKERCGSCIDCSCEAPPSKRR